MKTIIKSLKKTTAVLIVITTVILQLCVFSLCSNAIVYNGIKTKDGATLYVGDSIEYDSYALPYILNRTFYVLYRAVGENGWSEFRLTPPTADEVPCDVHIVMISKNDYLAYIGRLNTVTVTTETLDTERGGITVHYVKKYGNCFTTEDNSTLYIEENPSVNDDVQKEIDNGKACFIYRRVGDGAWNHYDVNKPDVSSTPCDVRAVVVSKAEADRYISGSYPQSETERFDNLAGITIRYVGDVIELSTIVTKEGDTLGAREEVVLDKITQRYKEQNYVHILYRVLGYYAWDQYKDYPPSEVDTPCDVRILMLPDYDYRSYMCEIETEPQVTVKMLDEEYSGITVRYVTETYHDCFTTEDGSSMCIESEPTVTDEVQKKIENGEAFFVYRRIDDEEWEHYDIERPEVDSTPCDVRVNVLSKEDWLIYKENFYPESETQRIDNLPGITVHYLGKEVESYLDEDGKLRTKCATCGKIKDDIPTSAVTDGGVICVDGDITLNTPTDKYNDFSLVKVVYNIGGQYSLTCPTKLPSSKTKCSIGLTTDALWSKYQSGEITIEQVLSDVKNVTFKRHSWEYSTEGFSLCAKCTRCQRKVKVTLDTTAIYDASRRGEVTGMNYSFFKDENWSSQDNISQYTILFNGEMTEKDGSTTKLKNVYVQPTEPGNYTATLALVNKRGKITMQTSSKIFYIADFPLSSCEVLDYGPRQIELFDKPEESVDTDGRIHYTVGTRSELLWCSYNIKADTIVYITLTNDIVLNPITVSDDGTVRSALLQIYRWKGLGGASNNIDVSIIGNGYSIMGIYTDVGQNLFYAGLISCGRYCEIEDLTVENSFITGKFAGAFMGELEEKYDFRSTILNNCNSKNNYIQSDEYAGGFIGTINNNTTENYLDDGALTFNKLINTSNVKGKMYSGGIVAATTRPSTSLRFSNCYNVKDIRIGSNKQSYAGGIIASLDVIESCDYVFVNCLNSGHISAANGAGGIIGAMQQFYGSSPFYLSFIHSSNYGMIGENQSSENYMGAMLGRITDASVNNLNLCKYWLKNCRKKYADSTGLYPNSDDVCVYNSSIVYPCDEYGCIESTMYSNVTFATCTTPGSASMYCINCNKLMYTSKTMAHGHVYDYNEEGVELCVYCGAAPSGEESAASLFNSGAGVVTGVAAVVLIGLAVVYTIIRKKKTKNAESD